MMTNENYFIFSKFTIYLIDNKLKIWILLKNELYMFDMFLHKGTG